ncbi:MAG: pectin acetylesterase-family hydrolase [Oligoflexales bacterium]
MMNFKPSLNIHHFLTFVYLVICPQQLLHAAAPWVEHRPGGETRCARGEAFSFFHNPGSQNKIIIDFIGGGACWDGMTCQPGSQTFFDSIDAVREEQKNGLDGIYRKDSSDNPFKDWTHVVIPYCTGDVHWGKNDISYETMRGEEFVIHHRGASNAAAVIRWVADNYQPEDVLITGCSAGAYGSVFWTPEIRKVFPNANMAQFGDSGAGIIPELFFEHLNQVWKPFLSAPEWIPGVNPNNIDWSHMTLNQYYEAVLASHSDVFMSQFHHTEDQIQQFFYELMMGDPQEWATQLKDSMSELQQNSHFKAVMRPGRTHCVLPEAEFLESKDGKPSVANWLYEYMQIQNKS